MTQVSILGLKEIESESLFDSIRMPNLTSFFGKRDEHIFIYNSIIALNIHYDCAAFSKRTFLIKVSTPIIGPGNEIPLDGEKDVLHDILITLRRLTNSKDEALFIRSIPKDKRIQEVCEYVRDMNNTIRPVNDEKYILPDIINMKIDIKLMKTAQKCDKYAVNITSRNNDGTFSPPIIAYSIKNTDNDTVFECIKRIADLASNAELTSVVEDSLRGDDSMNDRFLNKISQSITTLFTSIERRCWVDNSLLKFLKVNVLEFTIPFGLSTVIAKLNPIKFKAYLDILLVVKCFSQPSHYCEMFCGSATRINRRFVHDICTYMPGDGWFFQTNWSQKNKGYPTVGFLLMKVESDVDLNPDNINGNLLTQLDSIYLTKVSLHRWFSTLVDGLE